MAVLDALRSFDGPASIQQLASRLGLHTNTVRFHLSRLLQAGQVQEELAPASGPGRPHLRYRLVRPGPPQSVGGPSTTSRDLGQDSAGDSAENGKFAYRLLAQILASYLAANTADPAAAAASAGRQWGHYLVERPAPFDRLNRGQIVARVTAMLDDLGSQPEAAEDGSILLHRCPFQDIAKRQPRVACSVHLGLLQGAMAELGADSQSASIDRLVTERICIARLALPPEPT